MLRLAFSINAPSPTPLSRVLLDLGSRLVAPVGSRLGGLGTVSRAVLGLLGPHLDVTNAIPEAKTSRGGAGQKRRDGETTRTLASLNKTRCVEETMKLEGINCDSRHCACSFPLRRKMRSATKHIASSARTCSIASDNTEMRKCKPRDRSGPDGPARAESNHELTHGLCVCARVAAGQPISVAPCQLSTGLLARVPGLPAGHDVTFSAACLTRLSQAVSCVASSPGRPPGRQRTWAWLGKAASLQETARVTAPPRQRRRRFPQGPRVKRTLDLAAGRRRGPPVDESPHVAPEMSKMSYGRPSARPHFDGARLLLHSSAPRNRRSRPAEQGLAHAGR
ncbi:hypothetical protein VFPFJ_03011 [Purpureocillium lilacinum]|uniref:Uncharacterized protein n=1 Tax=Purpureocillium lilacinum TaxID=33203 RepID=A0A179HWJ8_PURLI|nr:hypothetical protein VFPFJ_03011 [Purpureocillium lilacinum]OAQ93848.1 hypothetical protein VFPFJ_03011 [Purpureocillium lilacinum]